MTKQPATDHISGMIAEIKKKIKHGKLKLVRGKFKTKVLKDRPKEVQQALNDVIGSVERKVNNLRVRRKAHTAKADLWKRISDEKRALHDFE